MNLVDQNKLTTFLKKKRIKKKFDNNLKLRKTAKNYNDWCNGLMQKEDAICAAFVWNSTPEKHNFWDNIADKWIKYCNTHR